MIFKAVVSNKAHPELGQATIPFPIPDSEYDHTVGLLEDMGIGSPTAQDCRVDEVDSTYPILNRLAAQSVNVDELDFVGASFIPLASAFGESSLIPLLLLPKSKPLRWVSIWLPLKRLDSFCADENAQFQAMAEKLNLTDTRDFINLTFCCQQATVITDFSDLERIGRAHYINVNGGCASTEELENLDGEETARLLINNGEGVVTPYGVVYDNGMKLEPLYDGRHFPAYLHKPPLMMLEINPDPGGTAAGYLYLPCPDRQIQRTLARARIGSEDFELNVTTNDLHPQVSSVVDPAYEGLADLNVMCRAIDPLDAEQRKKLEAVMLLAQPNLANEIHYLAENLDQFDFVPKPDSPAADSALTEMGYVAYHGSMSLEALMGPPHEPSQRRVVWGEEPQRNERALPCGQGERYGTCGDEMRDDPAELYEREQEIGGMA